jgi:hypothetical protein
MFSKASDSYSINQRLLFLKKITNKTRINRIHYSIFVNGLQAEAALVGQESTIHSATVILAVIIQVNLVILFL